jgi:hypothetical protein
MKTKHCNRYVQKARRKALLESFLETAKKRRREEFFINLLAISVVAVLRNWSMAKPANHEITETISKDN